MIYFVASLNNYAVSLGKDVYFSVLVPLILYIDLSLYFKKLFTNTKKPIYLKFNNTNRKKLYIVVLIKPLICNRKYFVEKKYLLYNQTNQ